MSSKAKLAGIYSGARSADKTALVVAELIAGHGLAGDGHAGSHPQRHISLFAQEVLQTLQTEGFNVTPGELSANLFTENLPLDELIPGTQLRIGEAILEIVQLRKPCHSITRISNKLPKRLYGQCGQLASVLVGGTIQTGATIEILAVPESRTQVSHAG
jgi:MOSC domain-containing protein YiiM